MPDHELKELVGWEKPRLAEELLRLRRRLLHAERQAPAFEASVRSAAELSGLGVWNWDMGEQTLTWSDAMFELTGISRAEFNGSGDLLEARLHPEDRERHRQSVAEAVQEACRRAAEDGLMVALPSGVMELRFRSPMGPKCAQSVCVAVASPKGPQRVWGLMLDMTSQREARQRLRESEARLRAFHEASWEGLVLVDDGVVRDVNAAFLQMLDLDSGQVVGRPFMDFVIASAREDAQALLHNEAETRVVLGLRGHPDRLAVKVHARSHPEPLGDHGLRAVAMRDISEQAALERELRHARKMEALGTLAGGIAHEFNNILTSVSGFAELAMRTLPSDSEATELLAQSLSAAERARDVVAQIQTFSRRHDFGRTEVDVAKCVQDALRMLHASASPSVVITSRCDPQAGHVRGDAAQLVHMLVHLCSNAWQARQDVTIEIIVDRVRGAGPTDPRPEGTWVRIRVRDDGPGMDEAVLERAFEPFFSTRPGGSGMGLSVVHGIIKAHDGHVRVDSHPGEGTCVEAHLPWVAGPVVQAGATVPSSGAPRGEVKIMVVDDEVSVGKVCALMLRSLKYEVEVFVDPQAALRHLQAHPAAYDLLLTDQSMPQLKGLDLAERAQALSPGLPVLVCTGSVHELEAERLQSAGVQGVLQKPYTRRGLQAGVEQALNARGSSQQTNASTHGKTPGP